MPVNHAPAITTDDPTLLHAVRQGTVTSISPRAKELVAHFDGRLFGRAPALEERFANVITQQQHAKIWSVVNLMANIEPGGTRYQERFSQLALDHVDRNLQAEQDRIFGEALVESLRYFEGPRWSDEKQEAWESVIEHAAGLISARDSAAA